MSEIFEELIKQPYYQELLKKLPEDEREVVIKALRHLTEQFEKNLLNPIRNLTGE